MSSPRPQEGSGSGAAAQTTPPVQEPSYPPSSPAASSLLRQVPYWGSADACLQPDGCVVHCQPVSRQYSKKRLC